MQECVICVEDKPYHQFPHFWITEACNHLPGTCLKCLKTHIKTEMSSKLWNSKVIKCPECAASLGYAEVEAYADRKTFAT
jgi:hypothetical protein